jgi:hypothetical protein
LCRRVHFAPRRQVEAAARHLLSIHADGRPRDRSQRCRSGKIGQASPDSLFKRLFKPVIRYKLADGATKPWPIHCPRVLRGIFGCCFRRPSKPGKQRLGCESRSFVPFNLHRILCSFLLAVTGVLIVVALGGQASPEPPYPPSGGPPSLVEKIGINLQNVRSSISPPISRKRILPHTYNGDPKSSLVHGMRTIIDPICKSGFVGSKGCNGVLSTF